jgi:hypothetical protein
VVSVGLMVEVLDHYHGAPRLKLWLLAFAEHASDETRTGWCPRSRLAERVGVSESRASHIASALIAEGVIKREIRGRRGRATTYVLAELNGRVRPERTLTGVDRVRPERTLSRGDNEFPW